MAYFLGYISFPIIIGFLIAHFAIAKPYEKKNGRKYNVGLKILFTLLIAMGLLVLNVIT